VDGIDVRNLSGSDDTGNFEVALFAGGGTDTHSFVSKPHMEGITICLRIHCDALDPKLFADADYS
jgi:hypothetical protein